VVVLGWVSCESWVGDFGGEACGEVDVVDIAWS